MLNKKAQVEIQFNWIYVSIAGVIILSVFVGIAVRMNQNSKERLAADAITIFDEIFTSVQASENTENNISLPGLDLEVESDNPACNHYSISGTDRSQISIEFTPFFSPRIIKTRILSYSLGWNMPFRVNYFIYMTSPGIAYVSIGNNEIAGSMPEHLNLIEEDNVDDFKDENYDRIRFFADNIDKLENVDSSVKRNKHVSAVVIGNNNEIDYYTYENNNWEHKGTTYYFDDTTLMAAIYSDNIEAYECNMAKAILRLNKFSTILESRADELNDADLYQTCTNYDTAAALLSEMESETTSTKLTADMVSSLMQIRDDLSGINTELNKQSCPTIY